MKKILIPFFLLLFFLPSPTSASTLFAGSAQQTVSAGQDFVVDWFLDTEGKNINAVRLEITFQASLLEVRDLSVGNSLVSLWVDKPRQSAPGIISLEGGFPGGISGKNIPVFRSSFKALGEGHVTVAALSSSGVLLHDGQGTQDVLAFKPLVFTIQPSASKAATVSSPTHPNPEQWYTGRSATIIIEKQPQTEQSFSFSSNLEAVPDASADAIPPELKFQNLPDGIYYFKLNSKSANSDWQENTAFRIQIDSTPPEDFIPVITMSKEIFNGQPFISFSTVDKTSGINEYFIKVGLFGKTVQAATPYLLHKPLIGDKITVTALDKAGNKKIAQVDFPGYISQKAFSILIALVLLAAIGFIVRTRYKNISQKIKIHD